MPRGEFDRSVRRARTRAQLLDAAARVYARRGFDGATLDEVAEEAGFTKGADNDHYGSSLAPPISSVMADLMTGHRVKVARTTC